MTIMARYITCSASKGNRINSSLLNSVSQPQFNLLKDRIPEDLVCDTSSLSIVLLDINFLQFAAKEHLSIHPKNLLELCA